MDHIPILRFHRFPRYFCSRSHGSLHVCPLIQRLIAAP